MNPVLDNFTMMVGRVREDHEEDTRDATARLCHVISNKLVPILAYAELGERLSQDEKVQAYCAKIYQSACDLRALLQGTSARQEPRNIIEQG